MKLSFPGKLPKRNNNVGKQDARIMSLVANFIFTLKQSNNSRQPSPKQHQNIFISIYSTSVEQKITQQKNQDLENVIPLSTGLESDYYSTGCGLCQ